ncbi:archease [Planctomycetota bacterium]
MSQKKWEHYSHPADMGIRGFGQSREEAFCQAALAMTAVITAPENIEPKEKVKIECEEADEEMLFVAWLNALLFEMATRNMLFCRFEVAIADNKLQSVVWGEEINRNKHNPVVEVKAATYADLKVRQNKDGLWIAQCVVDV